MVKGLFLLLRDLGCSAWLDMAADDLTLYTAFQVWRVLVKLQRLGRRSPQFRAKLQVVGLGSEEQRE